MKEKILQIPASLYDECSKEAQQVYQKLASVMSVQDSYKYVYMGNRVTLNQCEAVFAYTCFKEEMSRRQAEKSLSELEQKGYASLRLVDGKQRNGKECKITIVKLLKYEITNNVVSQKQVIEKAQKNKMYKEVLARMDEYAKTKLNIANAELALHLLGEMYLKDLELENQFKKEGR